MKCISLNAVMVCIVLSFTAIGCSGTKQLSLNGKSGSNLLLDTVKAGKYDMGKMWTFDNPPVKYFKEAYGFDATDQWLERVRKSALRFASYCSASFVSEDGLVMTNHHCGRQSVTEVEKQGEDLHRNGFLANSLEEERRVPSLYVDQLVLIKDVTKELQDAIASGTTDQEKVDRKNAKKKEIEEKYKKETGLETSVVTLYAGGEFSLYGYKRYKDVRLVFAPENQMGFFGGDYDNFTYPRYNLDCTFFRVYDDNGSPLKTENYFKWSQNGALEGEPVFVVGNPGRTNRLNTIAQLEYLKDYQYPAVVNYINSTITALTADIKAHPEKTKLQDRLFGMSNSLKVYTGILKGLNDPYLMARKTDFEKKFRDAVNSRPDLKGKYGNLWDEISSVENEFKKDAKERIGYRYFQNSDYYKMAGEALEYVRGANKKVTPQAEADSLYADFDKVFSDAQLSGLADLLISDLGESNPVVQKLFDGKTGKDAADYMLSHSILTSKEMLINFLGKSEKELFDSNDPFIYYIRATGVRSSELIKQAKEISAKEEVLVNALGRTVFDVYGTSIPPDATFTLRISDGIVKGYDYNGTIAPAKVTYYGLYDRFHSFKKEFPYDLPSRWLTPPAEFKLETPMCFVSTNDIIGGNSGSPVINRNAEIVGLAFDGNIESLPGQFIFTTEANRTLSVDSEGMREAIKDMYKLHRLSDELTNGKITHETTVTSGK